MNNHQLDIGMLAVLAARALDEQTNGKTYMLSEVDSLSRQAYSQYPEDPVIRQFAFTIEKMLEKKGSATTITQAEISNIYNHFANAQQDSKFRNVLGHLLKNERVAENTQSSDYIRLNRVDADNSSIKSEDLVNPNLLGALNSVFGGTMNSAKAYDIALANKGIEFVKAELGALGYPKSNVEIMGGDQGTLVYAAHFDTNKGMVTVAIPIALSEGKLLLPSTFIADDRLTELSSANLSYFIDKKAEAKDFSVAKVGDILNAINIVTGKNIKASDESFNDVAQSFKEEEFSFSTPSLFVDRKYEDAKPELNLNQQVAMPKELAHLAADFEDQVLEAVSAFGKEAVSKGKNIVASELLSAGFKNAQVKFGSESNDSIIYLATINTSKGPVEIEVPVEMHVTASGKSVPLVPSYFAYDGMISDFSPGSLQRFAANLPAPSSIPSSLTTAYQYMVLPELKNEMIKSVAAKDYSSCEVILSHIESRFSEEDYRNAISDYQHILMTKNSMDNHVQQKCSKLIPAGKGSIYARCGHYGVSLDKVAVDAQGHCRLKTAVEREKLNPVEDTGAAISTSKIFMS